MQKQILLILLICATMMVATLILKSNVASTKSKFFRKEQENSTDVKEQFEQFKWKYNKIYSSEIEALKRFSVFKENLRRIDEHNSKNLTYTVALNQYSDYNFEQELPPLEFEVDDLLEQPIRSENSPSNANYIDWRNLSKVTNVKNQGLCGSHWAFSSNGAIESLYLIQNGGDPDDVDFSEQQLVDCSGQYGNNGCNGGLMVTSFSYIRDYGIEPEEDYKYTATEGTCRYNQSKALNFVNGYIEPSKSAFGLINALQNGPVAVAVAVNWEFQHYSGGIFNDSCYWTSLNYAALAVAYGNEDGQDYIAIKNSWGGSWGRNGYIYVGADESQDCKAHEMTSQPY